eukprot:8891552-Lingulodinium_polyedra.AAC.1
MCLCPGLCTAAKLPSPSARPPQSSALPLAGHCRKLQASQASNWCARTCWPGGSGASCTAKTGPSRLSHPATGPVEPESAEPWGAQQKRCQNLPPAALQGR